TDRGGDFPQGQLLIEAAADDRLYFAEPCGCSLSGWFATRHVGDEFEDDRFHHDRRNVIGAAKLSAESMSGGGNAAAGEETRAIERCHGRSGAVGKFRADDNVEAARSEIEKVIFMIFARRMNDDRVGSAVARRAAQSLAI